MSNIFEEIKESEQKLRDAENKLSDARNKLGKATDLFKEKLYVGHNVPCKAAILPNGDVVVSVISGGERPFQRIYFVTPVYTDYEAKEIERVER